MIASYASGICGWSERGCGGGSCRWPINTSPKFEPGKGSRPVAIWNIITPTE